jgi:isoquinoline 1-oxidoreductase beta subunit
MSLDFFARRSPEFRPSRRRFLIGALASGASLVIGYRALPEPEAAEGATVAANPLVGYVRIDPDNKVIVISSQFDSGQGVYHGIATLVQEELDADWNKLDVVGGFGNPALYGNKILGMQATGGSTGMAVSFERYRVAGATARAMLMQAAALEWKVPVSEIVTAQGMLSHWSGRKASYGEFAVRAARLTPPVNVALKAPADWVYIGNEKLRRYDSAVKTDGRQQFTIDVKLPGMLTAVMIHPPLFGAKLKRFDATQAKGIRGVVDVIATPRGVAVVADHMWTALKARDLVTVEWDESGAEKRGSADISAMYHAAAIKGGETVAAESGDIDAAFGKAAKVVESSYEFPFLAHAPMEPLNAVVRMNKDGTLEAWGGHQYQDFYQSLLAKEAGIAPEKVVLHVMKTGGSFGRRAVFNADVIYEALTIARALDYKAPIKVQWTRENDMRAGQYRPVYVHRLKAGLDKSGKLIAWRHTVVGQSLCAGTPFEAWISKGVDPTSVEGAATLPYQIDNLRVDLTSPVLGVPVSFWRSVGVNHCGYAVESFIDEVAAAAGKDALQYRLQLLGKHPRHAQALKLAAEKAGWVRPLPKGWGRGIAVTETFGTVVAQVADVSVEEGNVKVHRVVCAVDCGIVINPDQVRAQMEGGIGFGLGAILKSGITLDAGKVAESNYADYDVLRLNEMPKVEVVIVKSDAHPSGAGEPGVPSIGPAVANALHAVTGKRMRKLPFSRNADA